MNPSAGPLGARATLCLGARNLLAYSQRPRLGMQQSPYDPNHDTTTRKVDVT